MQNLEKWGTETQFQQIDQKWGPLKVDLVTCRVMFHAQSTLAGDLINNSGYRFLSTDVDKPQGIHNSTIESGGTSDRSSISTGGASKPDSTNWEDPTLVPEPSRDAGGHATPYTVTVTSHRSHKDEDPTASNVDHVRGKYRCHEILEKVFFLERKRVLFPLIYNGRILCPVTTLIAYLDRTQHL